MTPSATVKNEAASRALRFRPKCRRIEPDADNAGYYCRSCGYDLIEVGEWYRHGFEWRHPEAAR